MAFSLNKVMLIGNLGRDAEQRFTSNNISVTTFSLATTRSYKRDDNWINETTWHNIVAYSISDFYLEKLKKGAKFYVEGRLSTRSYDDKEGNKKYITEIISEKMIPLDSKQLESGEDSSTISSSNNTAVSEPDNDLPF